MKYYRATRCWHQPTALFSFYTMPKTQTRKRYNLRRSSPPSRTSTEPPTDCENETMSEVDVNALHRLSDMQIVNSLKSLLEFATQIQKILNTEIDPALDELIFALSGILNNTSPIIQ